MDTKDRFLKMEENTKTTVSTLDTIEGSTKTIKYEFTEPLERDENITSRCRILLAIKQFVMQRKNRFLELEEKRKTTVMRTSYTYERSIKIIKCDTTNPLQQDQGITCRCTTTFSIKHKENVIMPPGLVKILKPNDVVHSSIILINTSNIDSDSDTTINNGIDSSDDSNDVDSNKSIQENVNRRRNGDDVAYVSLLCQLFL